MTKKVLFVDDEQNVLSAFQRSLRKRFEMDTATSGAEALEMLKNRGPYAVILSDMRMPGMDGVELLSRAREAAPDAIRMMLTGNADLQTAIEAVNKGAIFRFLNKPCEPETLALALESAIRQHELITAERDLLEQTLKGALDVLVDMLALVDPVAFGRSQSLGALAQKIGKVMELPSPWILGIASILSQIGTLTVPAPLVAKAKSGGLLTAKEREAYNRIPEIGATLIRHIPRMDEVSSTILYMHKNYNGTGFPMDTLKEEGIPIGSRILRVATDYLDLLEKRQETEGVLQEMEQKHAWYDPRVLRALALAVSVPDEILEDERQAQEVTLEELEVGMILVDNVETREGIPVVTAGTRISFTHMERLRNFAHLVGLREPFRVRVD